MTAPSLSPDDAKQMKENQDLIAQMAADADTKIPKVATDWSTGLVVLLTATGAATWLGGPALLAAVDEPWRAVAVIGLIMGIAGQVVALALLLWASTPNLRIWRLEGFSADNTVQAALNRRRNISVVLIHIGRFVGLAAAGLTLTAVISAVLGWHADTRLTVERAKDSVCGTVQSSDDHTLVILEDGHATPVSIPFDDIVTLSPAAAC